MTDLPLSPAELYNAQPDITEPAQLPVRSLATALEADFINLQAGFKKNISGSLEKQSGQAKLPAETKQSAPPQPQAEQSYNTSPSQHPLPHEEAETSQENKKSNTASFLYQKDTSLPATTSSPASTASHIINRIKQRLPDLRTLTTDLNTRPLHGRVTGATGTIIRAVLPNVAIGDLCRLHNHNDDWSLDAEVVGLDGREVLLTPMGEIYGVSAETEVVTTGRQRHCPVGEHLLGRVLDALGEPVDGRGALPPGPSRPVSAPPPPAMERQSVARPLPVGLRVLDGLLTCGEGQRIGVYGEAGAGKSTLMSAIVKGSSADVAVVALVGERGREVREFIEHNLGEDGLKKTVLIVSTSDRPAAERVLCAKTATTIAEYFRDQGLKVLLFVDNLTRYARALREIGLAAGEPPARRGFPPSVFAALPQLMERTGMGVKGSITAFYMVLVEDGGDDPIAEETRGILDGHIILSRALAASGHYPAIDVLSSRSRVMNLVTSAEHIKTATKIRSLWARYKEIEFLLQVGEYKAGGDPLADEAIAKIDLLRSFLQQDHNDYTSFTEVLAWLNRLHS